MYPTRTRPHRAFAGRACVGNVLFHFSPWFPPVTLHEPRCLDNESHSTPASSLFPVFLFATVIDLPFPPVFSLCSSTLFRQPFWTHTEVGWPP